MHRAVGLRAMTTAAPVGAARFRGFEDVHRRLADEAGDEQVGRPVLELLRRAVLQQHAFFHHGDAVGQGNRLGLVMGDEHRRHLRSISQSLMPRAQDRPQLRLELRHRLVEQIEVGVAHQRAGEAGALLLAGPRSWIG